MPAWIFAAHVVLILTLIAALAYTIRAPHEPPEENP